MRLVGGICELSPPQPHKCKAHCTLAAMQDTTASVGAGRVSSLIGALSLVNRQGLHRGCAGRATETCYQRLHSHTSNKHTQRFDMCCSIDGKITRRKGNSSKWLHLSVKTIIWCCFAADVNVAMLERVCKDVQKKNGLELD